MCGIWAVIGYHGNDMDLMHDFQSISGRGPDCYRIENINHFKMCCLGFHRLAIVGDSDGNQPIRVKSLPHINLICNGEIYNHQLLEKTFDMDLTTHCDIESMIHLYNKFGAIEMAKHLDGVFGCFIMDTEKRKVFLIRDRYGVRPLKFILTKNGFLGICSEAKGLINIIPNIPHESDTQINIVKPGTVLEFDLLEDSSVSLSFKEYKYAEFFKYPVYNALVTPNPHLDVYTNIRNLLKAAVVKRLQSERRIGCFLSGGLDSSLIAGILVQCMKEAGITYKLQTFSIGLGNDGVDILAARKVAKYLDTDHHEVTFTFEKALETIPKVIERLETFDITTIRASTCMYLISKYVQENTENVVMFSGEGADELAGGYIYFHKAPSPEAFHEENLRLLDQLHCYDIRRVDRTVSGWGLEPRAPFLDHWFSSYYLNLDPKLRQPQQGIEKWLIRKSFDNLGVIPQEILWRPKEAFSDGVSQTSSKSFFELLLEFYDTQISDKEFAEASNLYPYLPPISKEAYYYRKIFESLYPNQKQLTPAYWLPRFIESNDPSARTLSNYKSSKTDEC